MEFGGICGDEGGETVGGTGGAQAAGTSRWNPTKEQIGILEGLYKQGIRTPTTEQIQQITGRLRAYGHIEGKNVFYWFQNHKARQRQKQKQENLALLSRYFYHRSHSAAAAAVAPFPSSSPNVICGPYSVAPSEVGGFFPIHPMVVLPACGGVNKRRQRPDLTEEGMAAQGQKVHDTSLWHDDDCYDIVKRVGSDASGHCETTRKTLDLFPQHPTTGVADGSKDEITVAASPGSSEVREVGPKEQRAYFDFFSENSNH